MSNWKSYAPALAVLAACVMGQAGPALADQASDIAAVRQAVEKYQDVQVALADGYMADPAGHWAAVVLSRPRDRERTIW